jgi:Uma2 family endonuclease
MITKFSQLDLTKRYSYADYLLWKFQERVELLKGYVLSMTPAPSSSHQRSLRKLYDEFSSFFAIHSGELFFAPFDVRLLDAKKSTKDSDIFTVVQPDLIVICDPSKIDERGCIGAPDLVVEILSPGNSDKEMRQKYQLYEEAGVREYWIIHPTEKQLLTYVLENKIFVGKRPIVSDDIARSYIFPELKFPLIHLF